MDRLIFTATDRTRYFEPVMASWAQARGYAAWQPTVYLEPTAAIEEMATIAERHGAIVRRNTSRHGVLHNPWRALNAAFIDADFVVLAEDDILASDDILEYFAWARDQYRQDPILAICAASFRAPPQPAPEDIVVRHQGFCPLIWGTWYDRWANALRDTWDHDYSSGTPDAPQAGWDWNINLRVIPHWGWDVISPAASRVNHIGELGTHTTVQSFPGSVSPTFRAHRDLVSYVEQP